MNKKALYYRVIVREVDRMVNDRFSIRAEYSALSILIILWTANSNYRCKI